MFFILFVLFYLSAACAERVRDAPVTNLTAWKKGKKKKKKARPFICMFRECLCLLHYRSSVKWNARSVVTLVVSHTRVYAHVSVRVRIGRRRAIGKWAKASRRSLRCHGNGCGNGWWVAMQLWLVGRVSGFGRKRKTYCVLFFVCAYLGVIHCFILEQICNSQLSFSV